MVLCINLNNDKQHQSKEEKQTRKQKTRNNNKETKTGKKNSFLTHVFLLILSMRIPYTQLVLYLCLEKHQMGTFIIFYPLHSNIVLTTPAKNFHSLSKIGHHFVGYLLLHWILWFHIFLGKI
jgi:hypothetical protein